MPTKPGPRATKPGASTTKPGVSPPYPHLLSPVDLGPFTLPNRVIMGSMHTGLEDRAGNAPRLAAYFAERARGGAALMVTGGYAPNNAGTLYPLASKLTTDRETRQHRVVTDAVHEAGGRIALQILHAGRYAYHPYSVSASTTKSPITPFPARQMSGRTVRTTIDDFARCAGLAKKAGYDGVELMGSEGYLLNQFLAARTNRRRDAWGGSAQSRMRFPVEVVRAVRAAAGDDFLVIYRMSMLDLVEDGQTLEEVLELATLVERAGANVITTGIGWHEARIPTIATSVPRAAFVDVTAQVKEHVGIPVVASNRINMPDVAEAILAEGKADLVQLARPFLADADWVRKAREDRPDEINTCIACNQACLDRTFKKQVATCLVNPRAANETRLVYLAARTRKRIAVVGAGPAGLAAATVLGQRGPDVEVFEAADDIGGQFRMAARIPGKEEFTETLRYYRRQLDLCGAKLHLGVEATAEQLAEQGFGEVVVATGVRPRVPTIEGIDHPTVLSYVDVLLHGAAVGERVAIIGAGGIGVDVATFLSHATSPTLDVHAWRREWGVGDPPATPGGLVRADSDKPQRQIFLLQRSRNGRMGAGPGKTTGWIHRRTLQRLGVEMHPGVTYERIDDRGLHINLDAGESRRVLEVDNVVVCAGQESRRDLADALQPFGIRSHVIGGAEVAAELDAERAIRQASEVAARL
jgi:2,4-dienoyl-CoA reductase (NADPH2)